MTNYADKEGSKKDSGDAVPKGPVGQGDYIVGLGECMDSIAFDHGFFKDTLWNDPANAELKRVRKDPNILLAGDRVTIPPLRKKEESGATEKRHRFCRKGVPCKLQLRLCREGDPRGNESYRLVIDGVILFEGQTDGNGKIKHSIPPDAKIGRLMLQQGKEEYFLQLGHLDPVDQITGMQERLNNLGFNCGEVDGICGTRTRNAIARFQRHYDLKVDGISGPKTQAKMKEVYSC